MAQPENQPFCFWDVKSAEDVYFIVFNMVIIIILFVIAAFRLIKTFNFISRSVKVIYALVCIWGIVFLSEYIYALVIFYLYLNQAEGPKDIPQYSRVYSLFDAIPGYIIQSIFYYIWVLMFSNIRLISLKLELPLTRFERVGYPIIYFYFYFRFAIKITAWILALLCRLDQLWIYNSINILVLLSDAIILNLALLISLPIFLKRIDSFKLSNSEPQKRKLKKQYIFMIVSSSLRFILDLQLLIIQPLTAKKFLDCINRFQDHLQFVLQYTFFGQMILQFIPIFIILRLYHIKKQDRQMLKRKVKKQSQLCNENTQSIHQIQ